MTLVPLIQVLLRLPRCAIGECCIQDVMAHAWSCKASVLSIIDILEALCSLIGSKIMHQLPWVATPVELGGSMLGAGHSAALTQHYRKSPEAARRMQRAQGVM